MDMEFNSIDELYNRVLPALLSRCREVSNYGYSFSIMDIWNYLVDTKWRYAKDLTLYDIVSDIFNADCDGIMSYIKNED